MVGLIINIIILCIVISKKEIPPNEFMTKLEAYVNSKFDKLIIR